MFNLLNIYKMFRQSVPKPAALSGAPSAKKGEVTVIWVDDILSFPGRDANGIRMMGNIVLKAGFRFHKIYITPSTQKATYSIEGEEDQEGFMSKFEGTHSSNALEMREFAANAPGQGFVLVYGANCGAESGTVLGTPCAPMKFKGSFSDDKDATKFELVFEQAQRSQYAPGHYTGSYSFAENYTASSADIDFTEANGYAYQLPSAAVTDAITATSCTLETGKIISLIGGGGASPLTLSGGTQGAVTVLLKDNTQWVALKDAVITLEVFDAGTTTYLKEVSRA